MRASEILHGLAELMAGIESGSTTQQTQPQGTAQVQTQTVSMAPVEVDNTDGANSTTMVPPLQQKIELLKRSVNVDNEFNQGFDQIDQEQDAKEQQQPDELARMKKMAGINPLIKQELVGDEPVDD